jgi:hypothetical protein
MASNKYQVIRIERDLVTLRTSSGKPITFEIDSSISMEMYDRIVSMIRSGGRFLLPIEGQVPTEVISKENIADLENNQLTCERRDYHREPWKLFDIESWEMQELHHHARTLLEGQLAAEKK